MAALNPIEGFASAIASAGMSAPDEIHGDGKLYRFSATGKPRDLTAWYVFHDDGIPAGVFGDWRTGEQQNWCAKAESDLSPAERQAQRERIKAAMAQREADQARRQGETASGALALWEACKPVTEHPYLDRKGIEPHGARCDGHNLVIPMRDTASKLHSLQRIMPDGEKRFMPGGRVKGCYYAIGTPDKVLIVCEGFATGASIHEATGHAVAVAFNAGNLEAVATALHRKYPALRIIVAADDDYRTEGNPGRAFAKAAALAVGGIVVQPIFPAGRPDKATDFNDLHQFAGFVAVRRAFAEVLEVTP